ncbi:hypothetical protein BD324DRAFT_638167 [Kockovaella imperatae]|uniref:Amine oxidase domain-containing protein n=1 Tax=Kockovaella imperatae TaxID=4999 RepID=A0A1Y1U964_9TREE|nr:hypothetical protein BD324DRAFT_638167 [Kockovaella imperatae]ORX34046.1 hypothetical protein BD324DRAFT_638167 [Kockovaella imperatae]
MVDEQLLLDRIKNQILSPAPQAYCHDPGLMPYDIYKAAGGLKGSLGRLDRPERIAIIGSGVTGLTIAALCTQIGAGQIDLFEAKSKVGGRLDCAIEEGGQVWYPNGAMRIGPSSALTLGTMREFACGMRPNFPDPGKFMTGCDHKGRVYDWMPGEPVPEVYAKVNAAFEAYVNEDVMKDGQVVFTAPNNIRRLLCSSKLDERLKAVPMIQRFVDEFANKDFYEVLKIIFSERGGFASPGGLSLSAEDIRMMASAGIGTGPFDAIFQKSGLLLSSILTNGHEDQQGSFVVLKGSRAIDAPISIFGDRLAAYVEDCGVDLYTSTVVHTMERVESSKDQHKLFWRRADGSEHSGVYDTVFVCTPCHTMLNYIEGLPDLLGPQTVADLSRVRPIASTKVFATIKNLFHEFPNFYYCVTSDEEFQQMYLMETADPDRLAVLLSYSWGGDALRLDSHGDDEQLGSAVLAQVRRVIGRSTYPGAAKYFEDDQVQNLKVKRWHPEHDIEGAFGLERPGDGASRHRLVHHPLNVTNNLYIAGADLSHDAGWVEPAIISGYMAVISKLRQGGKVKEEVDRVAVFDQNLINFRE